jgi:hypothetical protein
MATRVDILSGYHGTHSLPTRAGIGVGGTVLWTIVHRFPRARGDQKCLLSEVIHGWGKSKSYSNGSQVHPGIH